MRNCLNHEEIAARVKEASGDAVIVLEAREGARGRLKCQCSRCGHQWTPPAYKAMQGTGCPACARLAITKGQAAFDTKLQERSGGGIVALTPYVGAHTRMRFACVEVGHTWETTPASVANRGSGCPFCAPTGGRRIEADIRAVIAKQYGGTIDVIGEFLGTSKPLECLCRTCGFRWAPQAYTLIRGHGCSVCNRNGIDPAKPATLYCFSFPHPDHALLYKIGITTRSVEHRYPKRERRRMTLLDVRRFTTAAEARREELRIIDAHAAQRFRGETGFSFSDWEVLLIRPSLYAAEVKPPTLLLDAA